MQNSFPAVLDKKKEIILGQKKQLQGSVHFSESTFATNLASIAFSVQQGNVSPRQSMEDAIRSMLDQSHPSPLRRARSLHSLTL
jgi:hypothetical protein